MLIMIYVIALFRRGSTYAFKNARTPILEHYLMMHNFKKAQTTPLPSCIWLFPCYIKIMTPNINVTFDSKHFSSVLINDICLCHVHSPTTKHILQ